MAEEKSKKETGFSDPGREESMKEHEEKTGSTLDEETAAGVQEGILSLSESKEESMPAKLLNIVKLMVELIRDYAKGQYKQTPWRTIAATLFAIIYLINPFDLVPDFIPGIGWLDDLTMIGLVISGVSRDLKDYCHQKGLDLEQYGL